MAPGAGLVQPAVRVGAAARRWWHALSHDTQDVLLTVAVTVATTAYYLLAFGYHPRFWGSAAFIVATCAPLALRRRLPLTSAALSVAVALLGSLLLDRDSASIVALAVVGSAAYHTDRRRWLLVLMSVGWLLATSALYRFPDIHPGDLVAMLVVGAGPVAFGYALRVKGEQAEQRARLHRARSLHARSEERARIARDVHDIVGHHLSAIRMQAVGGHRALSHAPDRAGKAFRTIADTSHRALDEIRGLLTLLNEATPAGAGGLNLSDIEELATRLAPERPRITVDVAPDAARDVPPVLQACVYRIVQESLTNVVRHSTASEARVRVEFDEREVVVTIDDDGESHGAPPTEHAGAGLRGMRERVRLLGGSFTCGPRPPRGWRVWAALPCDAGEDR